MVMFTFFRNGVGIGNTEHINDKFNAQWYMFSFSIFEHLKKLNDSPALHNAALEGRAHLVHLLLRGSANVDARDYWEWTPLRTMPTHARTCEPVI